MLHDSFDNRCTSKMSLFVCSEESSRLHKLLSLSFFILNSDKLLLSHIMDIYFKA